ncbi:hypothetical protein LguiA_031550 [Lonicera macranthoides]
MSLNLQTCHLFISKTKTNNLSTYFFSLLCCSLSPSTFMLLPFFSPKSQIIRACTRFFFYGSISSYFDLINCTNSYISLAQFACIFSYETY